MTFVMCLNLKNGMENQTIVSSLEGLHISMWLNYVQQTVSINEKEAKIRQNKDIELVELQ